jgi:hypothetical protein
MRHAILGKMVAVLAYMVPSLAGADATDEVVRSFVEGVYALVEWHVGDRIVRPPDIDGRFVVRDGVVVVVYRNWSEQANKITTARFGKYTLDSTTFSYSYHDDTVVTETASEAKASHRPAEAMRSFSVSREADGVHLRKSEGKIEFFFARDGLTYSENGKPLRVWHRMKSD